jgi:hypothetical protein
MLCFFSLNVKGNAFEEPQQARAKTQMSDGTYEFKGALEQWAFKNFVPKMCSFSTVKKQRVPQQWWPNLMSN